MSFQRPMNTTGPSSASYSEFLKDIYSSLRVLTTGLSGINQRLDILTQQLQSFDARLNNQDQMAQNLADRIDRLIQQTETKEIRQTTTGLSLLSELDTLGARQVEPSTGLADLGARNLKSLSQTSLLSKVSFQLPGTVSTGLLSQSATTAFSLNSRACADDTMGLELSENGISELPEISIPDIIIHDELQHTPTEKKISSTNDIINNPSTAITTMTLNTTQETMATQIQLGTNFLILD